ncbi:hypothetical protein ACWDTI_04620 [Gordonia sp. NPDC003424]
MSHDDDPLRAEHPGRPRPEQVLVIVLAIAGLVATLMLSALPMIAQVAFSPAFAIVIGAVNLAGYFTLIVVAAQSPLRWVTIRRVAGWMVGVGVLGAVVSLTAIESGSRGTSFLLAMSSLMAAVILLAGALTSRR